MAAVGSGGADAGDDEVIDLFVSYAHSDNEVPRGADAGWVSTLVGELEKLLRRKLGGRGTRIWRDGELAPNAPVTEELLRRVAASRVLLLVLSPGYCQSQWRQRELATFAARAAASLGKSRGPNELADAGDLAGITRRISGGVQGLAERTALYERARSVLGG